MGELTRNYNWTQSRLGGPDQWPQSLLTTLSILLNARFPMFLWWGEDLIQFYNDGYRPSLGNNGKHPTALGQRGEDCWPEIWSIIKPLIDQILSGGKATWSEDQLVPIYRNGKIEDVYWTFSYSPINDESGRPAGVLVTCTETTEKVANLKRLAESEDQLRFAIEATELGTWDYNPMTDKFMGNERLKQWFGLLPEKEVELSLALNLMAERDRPKVKEAIQRALQYSSGGFYDIEYTIIHPVTNQERIVRAKGRAWFNDEKIAYRFNGTLQDITEQVRARKKIEESEHRFHSLIEESPIATCLFTGKDLIIELANEAMVRVWGKGASVVGKPLKEALPELEGQPFLQILDAVFATGRTYEAKNAKAVLVVDGEAGTYYFDFTYKPLFNENGEVYGVVDTAVDVTQKVIAQKALEESEQNFRNLIMKAPVGICIVKAGLVLVEVVNEIFLELVGRTREELDGKKYWEVLAEAASVYAPILQNVFDTGITYRGTEHGLMLIRKGGKEIVYISFVYEPLKDEGGIVTKVMILGLDVTAQVLARKKIEESERNLRNIILQAPVAMCIFRGPDHVVEIANDRMFELWGKQREDVMHKPIFEGLPEAKSQGFEKLLNDVYTTGQTFSAYSLPVTLPRHGEMQTVFINFVYEAFREGDGTVSGIMAVATEVTEQVLATRKIESSEARFRLMADSMPQFVWTGDGKGNMNYVNQAVYDYSGLSYEEIKNYGWLQIIHPDEREDNTKQWLRSIETGEDFIFQHRFKNKDGKYRWQLSRAVPQRDTEGNIQLWIGTSTDIHDNKLFEEELDKQVKERTAELEQKNKELEQFAYAASHDMQEPLRKIQTFTNLLSERNSAQIDEPGKNYLYKIGNSVTRMKTIIDDLLKYSYTTKEDQQFVTTDLNAILNDIEEDLELVIQQKQATIIKNHLPAIHAVPSQMNQLFQNLMINALKFSKPDVPPKISIQVKTLSTDELQERKTLHHHKNYVQIRFKDNGIGFPEQYSEHIFELFKRLHNKTDYEGTGIGLSLCKKIVENHEGDIYATSKEGDGATFHVILPITNQ